MIKQLKQMVHTLAGVVVGKLPWACLFVVSLPLSLVLTAYWQKSVNITFLRHAKDSLLSGDGMRVSIKRSRSRMPPKDDEINAFDGHLFNAIPRGALVNLVLGAAVLFWRDRLSTAMTYEIAALFYVYMFVFACAIMYRARVRETHGPGSAQGEQIDKEMLSLLGVYMIERGSTSLWIYPVLSAAPAATLFVVMQWFQRTYFAVLCRPEANGTMVIDGAHCEIRDGAWNLSAMAPSVAGSSVAMYGIAKAFAIFMITTDPKAKGTLSSLHYMDENMEDPDPEMDRQDGPGSSR